MSEIVDALVETLKKFDQEIIPISESIVSEAIRALRDPKDTSEPPMELIAEVMAFNFCEDCNDQTTGWGTYFGPMAVWNNEDGTATETPNIKGITVNMIEYWANRAKVSKHPVLRSRYADLVWDFSKIVTKRSPDYTMANITIDCIIAIAQGNLHESEVNVKKKLERALSLAIALNDDYRIEKVRDIVISYEDHITQDSKLGLWGFSYDLLYENDKVRLTADQETKLISDLEGHLQRASQPPKPGDIDPWATEAAALRLAKHFRKLGRNEDIKRVMNALGNAFLQASSDASALQASAWLQRVHKTFIEFGLMDEAEKIAITLRELGAKVETELKPISHTIEISKEERQKYITDLTEGEPDQVFARIAKHYIPRKSEVEKQLNELAKEAPLLSFISIELQDNSGRPVAKVGSLEEDLSGRTINQMSQNMYISQIFLRSVLDALIKNYPKFDSLFVDYLFRSPIFENNRKSIIKLGVTEYLNGNHVTAVHILIPQIENAIRLILERSGGSVLKSARGGGFNLKILDDLLREPFVVQVLGEETAFYFRVLLVDQRGWNLRNKVCHGIFTDTEFGPPMSDRIIHVLLCLALDRKKETGQK